MEGPTVKALLTTQALRRYEVRLWHFCAQPDCQVVYFDDGQVFSTVDIRVPVWQKTPEGERIICYCFGENDADMRREIEQTATSGAVARVREGIKAKRCACDVRNPKGTCCLGDVGSEAQRIEASLSTVVKP